MTLPNHLFHSIRFLRPHIFFIFSYLFITISIPSALGDDDAQYTECRRTYDCGLLKNISYPFWAVNNRPQLCGLEAYELTCREGQHPIMKIEDQDFLVLNISAQIYTMTIARLDLWENPCTRNPVTTTLDYNRFAYAQAVRNLTLFYGCPPLNQSVPNNFTCEIEGTNKNVSYYVDDSVSRLPHPNRNRCYSNITVPISWTGLDAIPPENATADVLIQVLKQGFQVEYQADRELCRSCVLSNGTCGSNSSSGSFLCLCLDRSHDETCTSNGGKSSLSLRISARLSIILALYYF